MCTTLLFVQPFTQPACKYGTLVVVWQFLCPAAHLTNLSDGNARPADLDSFIQAVLGHPTQILCFLADIAHQEHFGGISMVSLQQQAAMNIVSYTSTHTALVQCPSGSPETTGIMQRVTDGDQTSQQ